MVTILSAALVAIGVLLAGSLPWGLLAVTNQRVGVELPWAVPVMALYLVVYVQAIRGRWLFRTRQARWSTLVRLNRVPAKFWPLALVSGLLGFAALLAFLAVMARLVLMPPSAGIVMPEHMPFATVLSLLAMQSVVAGVTEEAAFRGYMQGMIEREHGLVIAVVINGIWFGLLHFSSHPQHVLMMLPYYVAVAAVYGVLTWATNSILPAMMLHIVGDIAVLTRWWISGLPEWQLTAEPLPLLWQSGIDENFMIALSLLVIFTTLCALGYRRLRLALR